MIEFSELSVFNGVVNMLKAVQLAEDLSQQ